MKQSFQLENRHLRDGNDRHLNGRRFHFNHHREPRQGIWGRLRHDADPKRHHHHKNPHSHSWIDGFTHSTVMILSMEFMDKTFFISAIMAMTHNKWVILVASVTALFLMNGISCAMGIVLPVLMSRTVTVSIASVLFTFFGVKMIINGIKMDKDDHSELEEAQQEINSSLKSEEMSTEASPLITTPTTEAKICKPSDSVMVQVFLMIFFAEWGDRSQVSTILLAGTHPVLSVFFGGCVGYFVTSLLAVLGGSFLATKVSPRIVTIAGGVMFLLFAIQIVFMK
ncbi:hypothetical protein JH06_2282 [Blastocystis sp. subtype 4]|uniref:hypothetical protein n=1 Tax=Blastocystis sp. subtype 4 TaxID=944170 RepID=UPI0007122A2C|nr:hypothetical protein JH06_2282 [Blastocystis sp. subtype 4]KNB43836.1 hypothetical protein JH06_2282 [Blastocystis sp. subtype 4]|eukprot:XP_014527279.1 hypothetical protein JH06_2282 [Blastocystis sp. subtype 4]